MRASTFVFLSIFGLLYARSRGWSPVNCSVKIERATHGTPANPERSASAMARQIESELKAVDQRYRETEDSVRRIERSLRSLRDLVRKSEIDLKSTPGDPAYPEARQLRLSTHEVLENEFRVVANGYQNLLALRSRLEAERATLDARLQLARAGLLQDSPRGPGGNRPSPIEALAETGFHSAF